MPSPADYLRQAAESDVSAYEALEKQWELNEDVEYSIDEVSSRLADKAQPESGREAEQ